MVIHIKRIGKYVPQVINSVSYRSQANSLWYRIQETNSISYVPQETNGFLWYRIQSTEYRFL